jgi:hypothetical protein
MVGACDGVAADADVCAGKETGASPRDAQAVARISTANAAVLSVRPVAARLGRDGDDAG